MQHPLRITFHDMRPSAAIARAVQGRAEKLEQFNLRIQSCRVTLEPWTRRHHSGNVYTVTIDLKVPGKELAVGREHTPCHAHEDVYVAIRYAFDEMRRLLKNHAELQRGDVKGPRGERTIRQPTWMRLSMR